MSSFKDWYRQSWLGPQNERKVEDALLGILPFYPQPDATRTSKVIETDIGNGNYIHEFYIENTLPPKDPSKPLDVVLIHGYAAALGLFIDNFDGLSSIPGIKIHAIDLLGFGLSSRPKFPDLPSEKKEDVYRVEDWFIDSIEDWRVKRGINQFVLMGHSFGGYLSSAYALKYNKKITNPKSGNEENLIDRMVLISPVGLERNKYSLLKDLDESNVISKLQQQKENQQNPTIPVDSELTVHQEAIVHGNEYDPENRFPNTRRVQLIRKMWANNVSPFSIIRNIGPFKSKLISSWTIFRFAHLYEQDPKKFQLLHDYVYRIFNAKGSGEYALTRVLAFGAVAKLPLLDRCPQPFVDMKLPTTWLYGDHDWMNDAAGLEMTKEINKLSKEKYNTKLANFKIIPKAGHHLYLDNPAEFEKEIFKVLDYSVQ